MTKLSLNTVDNSTNQTSLINDNFQKIADELQNKVLYRDNPVGEPNTLQTNMDANGQRILNLPPPLNGSEPVRLSDLVSWNIENNGQYPSYQNIVDTFKGDGTANPLTLSGNPGTKNNTTLLINGDVQLKSTYSVAGNKLTPGSAIPLNATVEVWWAQPVAINTVDADNVSHGSVALTGADGASMVGFQQSGMGAVARTAQDKLRESVSVEDFFLAGAADDTIMVQRAITAAGVGGELKFFREYSISDSLSPLQRQKWKFVGPDAGFYYTASDAKPIVSIKSGNDYVRIIGPKFRATAGFTGIALQLQNALSCNIEDVFITNALNGTAVQFSGAAFYNQLRNVRVTSAGAALHLTGNSPSCPNNNIIDNFDIYGTVGTGLLCDGNPSMIQLNNFICEANTSVAHLKVTASAGLIFNNPRFEGSASGAYFDIVPGAVVTFNGPQFRIQAASNPSLTSDLNEYRKKKFFNLIADPLFVGNFATAPAGWAVTFGSFSSITKSTSTPGVSPVGSSLELVTSAAQSNLQYALSSAAVQSVFRGKTIRVHCLSYYDAPGTGISILAQSTGGAGGTKSVSSNNLVAGKWSVHTAELAVASDATAINFTISCLGNGGTFRLWAPVLEVDGSYYSFAEPTQERPWHFAGIYGGVNGNYFGWGTAAPTTGTWKQGDRVLNQSPIVGAAKGWICTAAGTPGTWVSEGNL